MQLYSPEEVTAPEWSFNVAMNGLHVFATQWTDRPSRAEQIQHELCYRFRSSEGFSITTHVRSRVQYSETIS